MKSTKKSRAVAGIGGIVLLLSGAVNGYAGSAEGLKLLDKEIAAFFMDGIKIKPQESDFRRLQEGMESLVLADSADVAERGEPYIIVTVKYEDETKDSFYFYPTALDGEEWYVEAEDGTVYQGGEFLIEDITGSSPFPNSEKAKNIPLVWSSDEEVKESVRKRQELHEKLKKDGITCSTEDLRAIFSMKALTEEAVSEEGEDAAKSVRPWFENILRVYEYAKQSESLPTEEKINAKMDEDRENIKEFANFEELDALYKECGTTYDVLGEELEDYGKIDAALEIILENLREEFKFGNDTIGEKVCDSYQEYEASFIEELVLPSTRQYAQETLKPLLDEAQEYYLSEIADEKK